MISSYIFPCVLLTRFLSHTSELEEYASSTVQFLSSKGRDMANTKSDPVASEKHGWLFVKTVTGSSKTTRSVWVRKWFFVKDGIFSWLVQGSKTGGVEEGEKVGFHDSKSKKKARICA